MSLSEVRYIPRGGMCIACHKRVRDCSNLPFHKMRVGDTHLDKNVEYRIVICSDYQRRQEGSP